MTTLELILQGDVAKEYDFIGESAMNFFDAHGVQSWQEFGYGYDVTIPENFNGDVCEGATKVVLIPDGKNYVIKIPFYGEYDDDDNMVPFMGATSSALEESEPNNYCNFEADIYSEAVTWGIEDFFVPTAYVCEIYGVPIYVQTRITNTKHTTTKENTFKYASIAGSYEFDCAVGARLVEFYTLENIETFLQFLKVYDLNDLDNFRNGGFDPKFGRHVFWDYAGYRN